MSEQVNFIVEYYDDDTLAEANEQLSMAVVRLHTENVKLRELVRSMVDYGEGAGSGMAEWFADSLRELGIKVDR